MDGEHLEELNQFVSEFPVLSSVLENARMRSRLTDTLLSNQSQLNFFPSEEERILNGLLDDISGANGRGSLYHCWTQMAGKKERTLEVPSPPLAEFIKSYLVKLIKKFPVHESCHGAEPGWSPERSLKTHLPLKSALSFDIQDAFHNVSAPDVFGFYYGHLEIEDEDERRTVAGFLTMVSTVFYESRRVLPQGSHHGPALFNRILYPLDDELSRKAGERGFKYSRWVDDFTLTSAESASPEDFMGAVELAKARLPISRQKIFFQENNGQRVFLLGHIIDGTRICKNSEEERLAGKSSPLDYLEWFEGNPSRRYGKW